MIPGISLGYVAIRIIFNRISIILGQQVSGISQMGVASAILLIFTTFVMLVVCVAGYVHRIEVKDVFYSKEEMSVTGVI